MSFFTVTQNTTESPSLIIRSILEGVDLLNY
jgi:hypothetical protein